MKAMILAAGLGTRLRPLTRSIPKALVEVHGRSMLEIIILQLKAHGFTDVIVNVHHQYRKIVDFLKVNNNFGIKIQLSHEKEQILDTGGGIKKAAWFLDGAEPFLVHNVDVISDIDLKALYDFHCQRKPLATLAVKSKDTPRSLLFDGSFRLGGWENTETGVRRIITGMNNADLGPAGFCGIHVIDPSIFKYMDDSSVFSIITTYMEAVTDHDIYGYPVEDNLWIDIGSFENLDYSQTIDPAKYLK
jgi:NDP-sugar pyrophosphorylase family protein